jgi:DNA-binding MarR family transcriptional regulator
MTLDERAADLGKLLEEILKRFQAVNAAAMNGPHVALNQQELRVVKFLGDEGPQIMRSVAEHLSLAVNSVTTIADGLEHKGLIQRLRSDEDRRIVRVELTESGRVAYTTCAASKLELFRSMLGSLTGDEQEILLVLFRKIARAGRLPEDSRNSKS